MPQSYHALVFPDWIYVIAQVLLAQIAFLCHEAALLLIQLDHQTANWMLRHADTLRQSLQVQVEDVAYSKILQKQFVRMFQQLGVRLWMWISHFAL